MLLLVKETIDNQFRCFDNSAERFSITDFRKLFSKGRVVMDVEVVATVNGRTFTESFFVYIL